VRAVRVVKLVRGGSGLSANATQNQDPRDLALGRRSRRRVPRRLRLPAPTWPPTTPTVPDPRNPPARGTGAPTWPSQPRPRSAPKRRSQTEVKIRNEERRAEPADEV